MNALNKSARGVLIATVLAAGALGSSAAMAWGGDCDYRGGDRGKARAERMSPEARQQNMQQRAEARLARMELALQLTPEQKPAWDSFSQAMKNRVGAMQPAWWASGEQPKTAVERMQRMEQHLAERSAELGKARAEVEAFYATLSEAQKTVFDDEFRFGPRMNKGSGKGGGR